MSIQPELNYGDSIVLNNTTGNILLEYIRREADGHNLEANLILISLLENKKYGSKELHITEQKYPEQTKRFKEILDEMYQVHLDKNADYSPMNILGVGMVGIVTRIWDKTSRICSLLGWNLQTGEYSSERKSTNDESIEDNLKDLGVYSIIARIYREGKWGR